MSNADTAQEELDFCGRLSILTAEALIEDSKTLDFIQELLSGEEWTPDNLDEIADAVRRTGRGIQNSAED